MFTNSIVIEDPEMNQPYQLPLFLQQQQIIQPLQQHNTGIINDDKHEIGSEMADEMDFLLKEYFTNDKYLSYIKLIEINKLKNQTLGNI